MTDSTPSPDLRVVLAQPITRLEFYAFVLALLGPQVLHQAGPAAAAVLAWVMP